MRWMHTHIHTYTSHYSEHENSSWEICFGDSLSRVSYIYNSSESRRNIHTQVDKRERERQKVKLSTTTTFICTRGDAILEARKNEREREKRIKRQVTKNTHLATCSLYIRTHCIACATFG